MVSTRYFCEVWLASCLNLTPDRAAISTNAGGELALATAGASNPNSHCRRLKAVALRSSCTLRFGSASVRLLPIEAKTDLHLTHCAADDESRDAAGVRGPGIDVAVRVRK